MLEQYQTFAGEVKRFSFAQVTGFALITSDDWLKKLAPLFHPIRRKTKTNRDSFARIFPRFASVNVIT